VWVEGRAGCGVEALAIYATLDEVPMIASRDTGRGTLTIMDLAVCKRKLRGGMKSGKYLIIRQAMGGGLRG
jgi:hypothetical protein